MNPDRLISAITLERVEAMATNPKSPKALRQFHAAQLADLRRRAAMQQAPARRGPNWDREIENETPTL